MTSPSPSTERVIADRYAVGQRRNAGLDVAVFEGTDRELGRTVAIRLVHPDLAAAPGFGDRFEVTMQRVASLTHPNLQVVKDWGATDWNGRPVYFVVTENLTAGSLRDLLDRGRLLTPSQALMIGLEVCRGLDAAHRAGLIHGDIRPSTLVFADDGRLKIVELGLAALVVAPLWRDPAHVSLERARYSAPELGRGLPIDSRIDVYSLALTLVEALQGSVPFASDSTVATLANRVDKLLPVSADLGPLAAVLERAARPDPADRWSAAELGKALVQAAEKMPRPAPIQLPNVSVADATTKLTRPVAARDEPVLIREPQADEADDAPGDDEPPHWSPLPAPVGPSVIVAPVLYDEGHDADGHDADEGREHATAQEPPAGLSESTMAMPVTEPVGEPTMAVPLTAPTPGIVRPDAPGRATRSEPVVARTEVMPSTPPPAAVDDPAAVPLLRHRRSRRRLIGLAVVIVLALAAGGATAWWMNRPRTHTVPVLAGMEQGVALNRISSSDWDVVTVEEASETVAAGIVIRSEPVPGTSLREGRELVLHVSTGPAPRQLPELKGLEVAVATAQLTELGLVVGPTTQVNDETVPAGTVVAWSVPSQPNLVAGNTVTIGTSIALSVSAGPALRVLENYAGLTVADAGERLNRAGLTINVLGEEFSPTVPAGMIIRHDPAPAATVPRGGTVSVVVSKGPDLIAVPNLIGQNLTQARATAQAAGFVVGLVTGDPAGLVSATTVAGAPLAADAKLPRGTAIDVVLTVPPPPPPSTTTAPPA